MKLSPAAVWQLVRKTVNDWIEDKAPQLGAALAFYTALSIAPLLVILLGAAAFFFGEEAARGQITEQLRDLVGDEGGQAIEEMIASANKPASGAVATALGVATLLFGASGVFGQLQTALNTIWEVQPKPGRGVWGFIRDRFLSFAMVMGIAFLLLTSLVITAALATLGELLGGLPDALQWLAQVINFAVSFAVITLLFAMTFKLLPDVKMAWSDVWLGAAVTAALFTVGKFAIGMYLGHSSMASSYGVAGSFVVLLVWVYYSAQILFFGAELTQVYANKFGSRIVPTEDAEPVTEEARAQEGRPRHERR
jgi:membrane protein